MIVLQMGCDGGSSRLSAAVAVSRNRRASQRGDLEWRYLPCLIIGPTLCERTSYPPVRLQKLVGYTPMVVAEHLNRVKGVQFQ